MRKRLWLAIILSGLISSVSRAQDLCQTAPRFLNFELKAADLFASSRGLDVISYKYRHSNRTVRLQDIVPGMPADLSTLNYPVKGHQRANTSAFFVLQTDLIYVIGEELQALLRQESSYDARLNELIMIRKKVGIELVAAARKIKGPRSLDEVVSSYHYLTKTNDESLSPALRQIQAHLNLYQQTDQWITQTRNEKKAKVSDHPLMVELRRQQRRVAERLSSQWTLVSAGCHNAENRYQVYENFGVRGSYMVFEIGSSGPE